MTQLPAREFIRSEFSRLYGTQPVLFRAPGRINIIGEHTDYNDGLVFPATVDLHTWVAASARDDGLLRATFQEHAEPVEIRLNRIAPGEKGQPAEYLKAVAWALGEEGVQLAGCDLLVGGNLPIGGGLSSSASLELAVAWALLECAELPMAREAVAQVCRRAEAEFVGMQCGIMDQYAIALGERGCAMLLDCRQLEFEQVRLPPGACFLVTHSGVSHRLPTGGYNTRRQECEEAVKRLAKASPGLQSLRDLDLDGLERQQALLGDRLYRRCRHVVSENLRVLQARNALAGADLPMLGALLCDSHASLRDDYEVSCPEVDLLVDMTLGQDGVLGSRMMGGGFGGCTISLVREEDAERAAAAIVHTYGAVLGREPWIHRVGPSGPVSRWED